MKIIFLSVLLTFAFSKPNYAEARVLDGYTDNTGHYIFIINDTTFFWGNVGMLSEIKSTTITEDTTKYIIFRDVRVPAAGQGILVVDQNELLILRDEDHVKTFAHMKKKDLKAFQKLITTGKIPLITSEKIAHDHNAEAIFEVNHVLYYVRYDALAEGKNRFHAQISINKKPFEPIPIQSAVQNENFIHLALPFQNREQLFLKLGFREKPPIGKPFCCLDAIQGSTKEEVVVQLEMSNPEILALKPPIIPRQYTPYDVFYPNCADLLNPEAESNLAQIQ